VAEDGNNIIATGYAQIRPSRQPLVYDQHSYLGFMYVAPDYRGQGINQQIIDLLVRWSQEQGIQECYLDVYAGNTAAIRAYEKLGFKPSLIEMKLRIDPSQ
jgi:RimJ/RimL family protein N-acetyltransferase